MPELFHNLKKMTSAFAFSGWTASFSEEVSTKGETN